MADLEEKRSMISKFVSVSGVSEERAKFYLESASWNLEVGRRMAVVVFVAKCHSDSGCLLHRSCCVDDTALLRACYTKVIRYFEQWFTPAKVHFPAAGRTRHSRLMGTGGKRYAKQQPLKQGRP